MYGEIFRPTLPGNLEPYAVNGMDSVDKFPSQPNQRYALFDKSEDIVYFFDTDASNMKTSIRRCSFEDKPLPKPEDKFVPIDDFNDLKEEMKDVKLSLRQLIDKLSATAAVPSAEPKQSGSVAGKHEQNKERFKAV